MERYFFLLVHNIILLLRSVFAFFINTEDCIICGNKCFDVPICNKCISSHFYLNNNLSDYCCICGKKLISETETCIKCRVEKTVKNLDRTFSLFPYNLWNVEIMFRWKKKDERVFSDFFAKLLAEKIYFLKKIYGDFVVVPVPPRNGKVKKIGWDQVDDLYKLLKYKYKIESIKMLERISSTEQKKLDRNHRLLQNQNSYIKRKNIQYIPKIVCLIDDVKTTGSTLDSCGSILRSLGVEKVYALTIYNVR